MLLCMSLSLSILSLSLYIYIYNNIKPRSQLILVDAFDGELICEYPIAAEVVV